MNGTSINTAVNIIKYERYTHTKAVLFDRFLLFLYKVLVFSGLNSNILLLLRLNYDKLDHNNTCIPFL